MASAHFPEPTTYAPFDSIPPLVIHGTTTPGEESSASKSREELWNELSQFYDDNEVVIEKTLALKVDSDNSTDVEMAINTYLDTANVLLDGLVALGNVHPVLGLAIFAFHQVIRLDIARRDNDRKVMAVKLQMQNMMCALFELRKLKRIQEDDATGDPRKAQLQRLIKTIAEEITKCGSDLNYYSSRKFVSKLIKASIYERRFADHIATFAQRRSELQTIITAYIATGIETANIAITEVGLKVSVMDDKINSILAIFRKLDTSKEREILQFLSQNGGPEECVSKDELLTNLLSKSGELSARNKAADVEKQVLLEYRKSLLLELSENLDEILAKNVLRFEKILNVQNNNLKRISDQIEEHGMVAQDHSLKLDKLVNTSVLILEEGKLIKKAVISPVKLKDPELQQIWDRMGLKGSVKAKTFVLQLRDHLLTDRSVAVTPFPRSLNLEEESSLLLSATSPQDTEMSSRPFQGDPDAWVMKYIDAAHLQPIVEAIDEDGSGFISVKEANKFALSRPKGWSLIHWMAYWAAGWHLSVTNYKSKIYAILLEMHRLLPHIHIANRSYVDDYLDDYGLNNVEALLRSINPFPDGDLQDAKLTELAQSMTDLQEQRILTNLTEVSFLIASPPDAALVASSGRVETWILPLLYLVLKRHLEVIKIAVNHVLDDSELTQQATTLHSIFVVFDERMRALNAIFRQMYRDVEGRFRGFAHGMFHARFKDTQYIPIHNVLLTNQDASNALDTGRDVLENIAQVDLSILSKGPGKAFEYQESVDEDVLITPERVPHPIEGTWTGACRKFDEPVFAYQGAFHIKIGPVLDGKITGQGESCFTTLKIVGDLGTTPPSDGSVQISMKICSDTAIWTNLICNGTYDPDRDTIRGEWKDDDDDPGAEVPHGPFFMTRTPPGVFRYRYLLEDGHAESFDTSWSIARKRWVFAIRSVLHSTRDEMGSSKFALERLAERRRWIELSVRWELQTGMYSPRGFITPQGKDEFARLMWQIHPPIGRIFERNAVYFYERKTHHLGNFVCDACGQRVTHIRFQCITCMEDDLSNQLDFCDECIDTKALVKDTHYVHQSSHSLLRSTRRVHECQLPILIPQARSLSERVKSSFRASESAGQSDGKGRDEKSVRSPDKKAVKGSDSLKVVWKPSLTPLICACCDKELTLPCWACATCARDTLICYECDAERKPVLQRDGLLVLHRHDHPLLRIYDSVPVKVREQKASQMERKLEEINDVLTALDAKVDAQLDEVRGEVKAGLDEIAKKIQPILQNGDAAGSPKEEGHVDTEKAVPDAEPESGGPESKIEERLSTLEKKVDTQLSLLISMMQQLISETRTPNINDPA